MLGLKLNHFSKRVTYVDIIMLKQFINNIENKFKCPFWLSTVQLKILWASIISSGRLPCLLAISGVAGVPFMLLMAGEHLRYSKINSGEVGYSVSLRTSCILSWEKYAESSNAAELQLIENKLKVAMETNVMMTDLLPTQPVFCKFKHVFMSVFICYSMPFKISFSHLW